MSGLDRLVFVDCEARGQSPWHGQLAEFGAAHFSTRKTFHGKIWETNLNEINPAVPDLIVKVADDQVVMLGFRDWLVETVEGKPIFISDNPAYDYQWINYWFDMAGLSNPFGHSARRIGDFWAGKTGKVTNTTSWKKFRKTPHDHNPVNDAMGNVEAFEHILSL